METRKYIVADHCFEVRSEQLCQAISYIAGFMPFEATSGTPEFSFEMGEELPAQFNVQYSFTYEDILGEFGSTEDGFFMKQTPANEEPLYMWTSAQNDVVLMGGNFSIRLLRFALWIGYGLMTTSKGTIAIHSSCIVSEDKAVIFLGESGTGKSTHSRLWLEHISDTSLLNDDNPVVWFIDGEAVIYGTPWSGKTPCYKNESMPLKAVVRLSQAPYNKIARLVPLQSFASLMPACSCMRWDGRSVSALHKTVEKVIGVVPCWHLECLPDKDAAVLCNSTVKR